MNVALRSDHLNLISICTGGFGLDLGVELAVPSARTVCMVEREAFAVAQLVSAMEAGHMASAPIWSDARTFNGRAWRGAVDGLIGGIPCQPHSLAGRKQGQNDERDLWSDARRIIVQSGAWFVLIENVSGMLSAGSDEIAGAERVCRDLHKLGFSVEGGLFTASEVGAPHQRERVFILAVADRDDEQWRGQHQLKIGQGTRTRQQPHRNSNGVADANGKRLERLRSDIGEVGRADARRSSGLCDGTALVHAERSEWRPHAVVGHELDRKDRGWSETSGGARESGQLVDDTSIARSGPISVQPRRQDEARRNADWPSTFPPGPGDANGWREVISRTPELEPAFRRMADGLASRLDIARVDRLRMLGNGVVPLEAAYALRTLITRLAARGSAGAARLVRMMEGPSA
ncbi:DNA cytosine methyltransferase [Agrobacterium cavarae]|uniref:DNA cytosine methyltransferase n=1 Tax=Agrobacterium cavarae TaxID=2528239 RepID=UPI003D010374